MAGDELTPANYKAYFDLMQLSPSPWEVKAVAGITQALYRSRS